jgi:cyanophycinase-like exopeptidase
MTLENDFLHFSGMENVITDQHLAERDRIGRTVAMLARLLADGWTANARALAADRETSVHVDPATGIAEIFSTGEHETPYAYFLSADKQPAVCEPGIPLGLHKVQVQRLAPGDRFDLRSWSSEGGIDYSLDVDAGVLKSSRGDIY